MSSAKKLIAENQQLKQLLDEKNTLINEKNNIITETLSVIEKKDRRIDFLEEFIKQAQRKLFAPSSEKLSPDQLGLFNEAETFADAQDSEVGPVGFKPSSESKVSKKRARVAIPKDLPREDHFYDLPDDEKICPLDGARLKALGTDDHEQLEIIPAQIKVIRHRCQKYLCPCCNKYSATAAKPGLPIEKSIASPSLLAFIATQKYGDALPLYRQSEIFKRIDIDISRANMANWMVACGALLQPVLQRFLTQLQAQPVVHMDETVLQVLKEPNRTPQSKSYLWVMANFNGPPITLFHYAPSRRQAIPLELLNRNNQAVMVDGYEGYEPACQQYNLVRLGCWAHARRKFVDAQKMQVKGKSGKADVALAEIQKLYRLEQRIKDEPPDKRYQSRQEQAKPIVDKLRRWLDKSLLTVLPKSELGKALSYLHHQWPRLIAYLEDGRYPIDNNRTENAIRPFAVGRKNWLFSDSQAGAHASAAIYSVIETAKANGLNPFEYLTRLFKELPNVKTDEALEKLLPWHCGLNETRWQ